MSHLIRVTVWNEGVHEKTDPEVSRIYPRGMHGAIADHLSSCPDVSVRTATLDQAEHGLTEQVLAETDVLIWWGHRAHHEVADVVVDRVQLRVLGAGMGLICLHSAHYSKIFRRLMGTSCNLKWREVGERQLLWITRPGHPILQGVQEPIIIDHEEMYGEHFDIPEPDETILISSFTGGEVFRSGCTFRRGAGKIFYFQPGHETHPTFHHPVVLRIIANAVRWAAPTGSMDLDCPKKEMGWFEPK